MQSSISALVGLALVSFLQEVMNMAERWKSGLHHPAAVYAKQVTQGRLREQCCKYEILACQRFLDDLRRQGTDEFPY